MKIHINELIVLLAELLESRKPLLDVSLTGSERMVQLFLETLHRRIDEPWTLRIHPRKTRKHPEKQAASALKPV